MRPLVLAVLSLLIAAPAAAQIDSAPKVQVRLVAETGEVAPGGTISVALEEVIKPTWHTYWINPGEAGLPTKIDWTLPAGWKAGPIQWPYPQLLPVPPLMNFGYEGTVWLLSTLTVPAGAKPGTIVTLKAHAWWLVCQQVCVPEDQELTLPVSVTAAPQAPYATVEDDFAAWRAKIPARSPWPARYAAKDGNGDLELVSDHLAAASPVSMIFFPYNQDDIADAAPQRSGHTKDGYAVRLKAGPKLASERALSGVVVITSQDNSVEALEVSARKGAVPPLQFSDAGEGTLWTALLFALFGGLILNLMPCVLPILAMKALAIANKAHAERGEASREGFAYGAGAVLSFVALGLAVVALRAGGAEVGWGFQLQDPAAVAGFALLVFAVGLNLSGVFEFSGGILAGDGLARRGGTVGAFFTGVLAVAVAAPCTAPFMAAALGYALTQSAALALLVFLALGIGFALPFVLLGMFPRLLRFLPRPGAWMLRFKQLLAFPMYGAAAWLVWVLVQEAGSNALVIASAAMIALAFAAWAWNASHEARGAWRIAGVAFAALGLIAVVAALVAIEKSAAPPAATTTVTTAGIPSEPYSAARLAQLRAAKQPVFVDATAAWCITCLVNEKVALSGAAVHDAFVKGHIAYLVADWTNRNAEITALLEQHGRSGVPLYLYYAPGAADAVVLPQVLTEGGVLKVLGPVL
ncbi:MAG TPA: thioredoxin family protein [Rhizomicrobium sp.]|jgi:thiol:disulfide interchange protein DsbD|nr:thioredoxin family protein [Rhizomicrobium sp.]